MFPGNPEMKKRRMDAKGTGGGKSMIRVRSPRSGDKVRRPLLSAVFVCLLLASLSFFPPPALSEDEENAAAVPETYAPRKIPVFGTAINLMEMGRGEPLLFLHGLGGSWKDWGANLEQLARNHRVIAFDFPGFGDSEAPQGTYSIEALTSFAEKILADRNIQAAYVVGHSMGGLVALNMAARQNSRVKGLVLVDVVGTGDKAEFISHVLTKKIMGTDSRWTTVEGFLRDEFKGMFEYFIQSQKPKTSREFFESMPKAPVTGTPALPMTPSVQMSASIMDFDVRPLLPAVRQPVLILWGGKDPIAPPLEAQALQSALPRATLIFFKGAGHSPMLEHPNLFNQEVRRFLQAAESGSSR
jgi:pimeloyl-ACP methyl ester carboxylesterase